MNFTSLQYFLLASETLNLTKASEKLYISQQAVSNHVKTLERELGVELFHRAKHLTLTYAGIRMVHYASEIIKLEQQMQAEMKNLQAQEKGNIRVAINETRAAALMPDVLLKFCEEYPYVKISVIEGDAARVDNSLIGNESDLAIGLQPVHQNIQKQKICTERLVLIVPKRFLSGLFGAEMQKACKKQTDHLDLSLFTGLPFVTLDKSMLIQTWADEYLSSKGVTVRTLFEVTGLQTLFSLACNNAGIAFFTETFLYSFRNDLQSPDCPVCVFPVDTSHLPARSLGIYSRRNKSMSNSAQRFVELIQQFYHSNKIIYRDGSVEFRKREKE